jgi:DNA-binding XRE family transcriptional regulator
MSVVAKMLPTEMVSIKIGKKHAQIFYLPKDAADNLLLFVRSCHPIKNQSHELVTLEEINPALNEHTQRIASILRGARHKEEMTQMTLAKKLNITQSDLSKMENGKRSIGKKLAQRLGKILNVDYRIFL